MPDCGDEPDLLPSALARCGEVPLCEIVHCFRRVGCLIANTTALVIPGCRTPSNDASYYCVCPLRHDPITFKSLFMTSLSGAPGNTGNFTLDVESLSDLSSDLTTTDAPAKEPHHGISGGAIAGIVIGIVAGIILFLIVGYFIFRKLRDRRKNHGEYRPQFEENMHAKNLPCVQPPHIEGYLG
uniref:EGF-like domain-containing protein n=1 Tax=Panagrellus redivivus TaxID=6233 RepID=A0A7E4ZPX9_PANRE